MRCVAAVALAMIFANSAAAGVIIPTSYAMLNGMSGYWADVGQGGYWDRTYSGSGNPLQDVSPLSGGSGQLTDSDLGGLPTPGINYTHGWVGWQQDNPLHQAGFEPTITFNFSAAEAFNKVSFYVDNSGLGDVFAFGSVTLSFSTDGATYSDSLTYSTTAAQRAFSGAEWIDIPVSATALSIQSHFTYQSGVTQDPRGPWIFLSEAKFDGPALQAVPEPSSAVFWLLVPGLLSVSRRIRAKLQ